MEELIRSLKEKEKDLKLKVTIAQEQATAFKKELGIVQRTIKQFEKLNDGNEPRSEP